MDAKILNPTPTLEDIISLAEYVGKTPVPFPVIESDVFSKIKPFTTLDALQAEKQRQNTFHALFDTIIQFWKQQPIHSQQVRGFFQTGEFPRMNSSYIDCLFALFFFWKVLNNVWPSVPLQTFDKEIVLYRGVGTRLEPGSKYVTKQQDGRSIVPNIITSWSSDRNVALEFSKNGRGSLFVARIPKNTKFYYIAEDIRYVQAKESEFLLPGGQFVIPEAEKQLNSNQSVVVLNYEPLDQSFAWPGWSSNKDVRETLNNQIETYVVQDWMKRISITAATTSADVSFALYSFFKLMQTLCGYEMSEQFWNLYRFSLENRTDRSRLNTFARVGTKFLEDQNKQLIDSKTNVPVVNADISEDVKFRTVAQQWSFNESYVGIIAQRIVNAFYDETTMNSIISKESLRDNMINWWSNKQYQRLVVLQYGTQFTPYLSFRDIFLFVYKQALMDATKQQASLPLTLKTSQEVTFFKWKSLFSTPKQAAEALYDVIPDEKVALSINNEMLKSRVSKEAFVQQIQSMTTLPKFSSCQNENEEKLLCQRFDFLDTINHRTSAFSIGKAAFQSILTQQDDELLARRGVRPLPPVLTSLTKQQQKPGFF